MQRYHMMVWRDDVAEPVEHIDGEWVRYSDAEAELAHLRAEVEKLRADVVWAVEEGVFLTPDMLGGVLSHSLEIDEDGEMCAVSVRLRDGTDASLLSAVRRAREERK